jgi:hypothetical protein
MSSKSSKEFCFHKSVGACMGSSYFLRERLGQCAQCKLCTAEIKTVGGSTKRLHVPSSKGKLANIGPILNQDKNIGPILTNIGPILTNIGPILLLL